MNIADGIINNTDPIASNPLWLYLGIALLVAGLLWAYKKLLLVAATVALGFGTYVTYDLGGKVDKFTVGFGMATVVALVVSYFVLKSKGGNAAPAAAPAPVAAGRRR